MRKTLLTLALAACATSPLALAQHTDDAAAAQPTAVDTPSSDATDLAGKQRSAFGRVMTLLTHALQEAQHGNLSALSAAGVTVTVTPVTGPASRPVDARQASDAAVDAAADATASAPLAVQTGDGGAD